MIGSALKLLRGNPLALVAVVAALALAAAGVWTWGHQVGAADERAANEAEKTRSAKAAQDEYVRHLREDVPELQRYAQRGRSADAALARVIKETEHVPSFIATPAACPDIRGVHLSAGAVRVWNTALAGADPAAAACGADGAGAAACAADSGVAIERAYANAIANFRRLNRCVTQLDALQDVLARRGLGAVTPTLETEP